VELKLGGYSSIREQLSCLTKVGFDVFALLPYFLIFVMSQEWRVSDHLAVVA
jgi:hypothetical protein